MRSGVNVDSIAYEDRVLLWARRRHEAVIQDRRIAAIALEVGADLPEAPAAPTATIPGDGYRLRGIPVVGVHGGIGGAIVGTRPGSGLA